MRTVSAAEANRDFSKLLRAVREGETVLITARGEPVATLAPPGEALEQAARAKADLLAYLESQPVRPIEAWTRDELYD
jgi:prevent-host-death family protein